MTALPSLFRQGALWLALSLLLWALLVGLPVFVGHRCGFGFGCLTSAALLFATWALIRLAFPVRA